MSSPVRPIMYYNEYTLLFETIRELSKLMIDDMDRLEDVLPGWREITDTAFLFSDTYLKAQGISYRIFEEAQLAKRFAMPYIAQGKVSGVLVQCSINTLARVSAVASGLFVGYDFVKKYPRVAARFSNFLYPNSISEDVDPEWLEQYMEDNKVWVDIRDGLVFAFQDVKGFFLGLPEELRDEINASCQIPADWNEAVEVQGMKYGATDFFSLVYYNFRGVYDSYCGAYNDNITITDVYTLEPANYLYTTQPRVGTGNEHDYSTTLTQDGSTKQGFQELSGSYTGGVSYPIGPLGFYDYQNSSGEWLLYPLVPSKENITFRKPNSSTGASGKTIYQGHFGNDIASVNEIQSGRNAVGVNLLWTSYSNYSPAYVLKRHRNVYCREEILPAVKNLISFSVPLPDSYVKINPSTQTASDLVIDYESLTELEKQQAYQYFRYEVLNNLNGSIEDSYRYAYKMDTNNMRDPLFMSYQIPALHTPWDRYDSCHQQVFIKANCYRYNAQTNGRLFFPFITRTSVVGNEIDLSLMNWENIPEIDPIEPDNLFYYKITNTPEDPEPEPGDDPMNNPYVPVIPDNDGNTPDPIPPIFPEIGSSGLVVVYNPTALEMKAFGQWLWDPVDTALNTILKMFQNPMDCIITLHILYCKPNISAKIPIRVGYLDSNVEAAHVLNQFKEIDMGEVFIPELYNTYLDYGNETEVEIYLPFIGFVELDTNDVMNAKIGLKYMVDVYTGSCVAIVRISRNPPTYDFSVIEYTFMGNCAMQVPVTGSSFSSLYSVAISAATAGVSGKILTKGGGMRLAGASSIGAAGHGLAGSQIQVSRSGNLSGNYGVMTGRKPYVLVRYPMRADAPGYNRSFGYQSSTNKMIKDMFGYIKVKSCNIYASGFSEENDEIEALLKSGVLYGRR